jgi:glycosyltransferase involved in cell wall biosynthesis
MNGFDEDIFRLMDLERAEVLSTHKIDPIPEVLITFVGKLADFKGVDVLLDAAAAYEQALESAATLIIGDGELRQTLAAQAERLGLKGVHFLGHQPQTEVARLLNVADLSIVPSRVEPFGLVAVEALACGTPVVATNEGGLPDFIDDRVGTLVNVGDAAALANAIIDQVRSASKQRKGPFAAEYAHQYFSWSVQVDKMIDIYELIKTRGEI